MTRARNTASVISKHLPNVPVETCDFLREGAPIRPEPSSPNWRPEAQVSAQKFGWSEGVSICLPRDGFPLTTNLFSTIKTRCDFSSFMRMALGSRQHLDDISIELAQVRRRIATKFYLATQTLLDILFAALFNFHPKLGWDSRCTTVALLG